MAARARGAGPQPMDRAPMMRWRSRRRLIFESAEAFLQPLHMTGAAEKTLRGVGRGQ